MAGTATVTMFRGQRAAMWAQRLREIGWPDAAAKRMAQFLVSDGSDPPRWSEIASKPADPASSAAALPPSR